MSVQSTGISDADPETFLYVHRVGHPPALVEVSHFLRPVAAFAYVSQLWGPGHSFRFRFPFSSPLCCGAPVHCVLSQALAPGVYAYAVVDLRRVLRPPLAPFITVEVPAIITFHKVLDLLVDLRPFMESITAIYVDETRLDTGISPSCNACTITLLSHRQTGPQRPTTASPAVLDTYSAVSRRPGFALARARRPSTCCLCLYSVHHLCGLWLLRRREFQRILHFSLHHSCWSGSCDGFLFQYGYQP